MEMLLSLLASMPTRRQCIEQLHNDPRLRRSASFCLCSICAGAYMYAHAQEHEAKCRK